MSVRRYHAASWGEPTIMEMGRRGERGIIVSRIEEEIRSSIGDIESYLPQKMLRKNPPKLPELSQPQVLRHYLRLSQETLGMELNVDISEGTCTMKYSPKVNEQIVRSPKVADLHPLQDEETVQGILEIIYKFAGFLGEISGMDEFSFQPGGGADGIYANACMMRKYHNLNGELERRNEVISTAFSHPVDCATPAAAGFKVITLYPNEETGFPDIESLKAAVSDHTAGLFITNPEDTGIYNPRIDEFVKTIHEVGGLCHYDQANANVLLGIARAKDAGFDMCHFNVHKTFSSPHGSMGPACGAVGVREKLAELLPVPVVTYDGTYHLDYGRPRSIGKIRDFHGNVECVVRAYAWIMSMGAEGLRTVAETSAINNSYLEKRLLAIPGITKRYPKSKKRLDQIRYSLEKLREDTGVKKEDVSRRLVDLGIQSLWYAHPPELVPEPFTPEPCETYSKEDCDEWAAALAHISEEAYADPEFVKRSPHSSSISRMDETALNDPERWAMTWRAYLKKSGKV